MNTGRLIDDIIRREGGFVNDPSDRGGATKYGITIDTLAQWRGRPQSVADVQALTEDEARKIYRRQYIESPYFDKILDQRLRALVVDCGVNHGTRRAAQWLQEAAGVTADGVVGPVTLEAVNNAFASSLFKRVLAKRIEFYAEIVRNDPGQSRFLVGWMRRANEFLLS